MRKSTLILLIFLSVTLRTMAQALPQAAPLSPARPKLVVGIVVDQMRYDYVYRFWNKFGNGGFKRLYNQGVFCTNTHYNYVPTNTGPGHTSIYTGSVPAMHGIVGNEWYSRAEDTIMYCTRDDSFKTVGAATNAGKMSPRRLLTSTITDELRLGTNMRSKVVAIAIKDRGAILPGGHLANAAYFFDPSNGKFVTSSYYNKSGYLPGWLSTFNDRKLSAQYCSEPWTTFKNVDIDTYTESIDDNSKDYEKSLVKGGIPTLPVNLPLLYQTLGDTLLRTTPFGNNITTDMAIAAMEGEQLGKRDYCDFISISYSSTDYIGHQFGPYSKEIEDCYIRFDEDLARLLNYLDKTYGTNNVLLFLTADHGVADVPKRQSDLGMPAGITNRKQTQDTLKKILRQAIGDTMVLAYYNQQVFLKHSNISKGKMDSAKRIIKDYLMSMPGVQDVSTNGAFPGSILPDEQCIARGYLPSRCGDIVVKLQPGWFESTSKKGTTHSAPYNYDTHVPLFWYGYGITPRKIIREVSITDIAPTLAQFMKIQEPNGSIGKVIEEIVK